ncbi:TPA: hypothetical protein HA231_02745 [Candidatus Woesearchaeota archaeon]|nr:hypothetical protein [Candidatus Woesearchaeota archaeon]
MVRVVKEIVGLVGVAAFIAGVFSAARGGFFYPLELFLLAMIGLLLVASLATPRNGSASPFVSVILFIALVANSAYLYVVSGHISTTRLAALTIAIAGLAFSLVWLLAEPVPAVLSREARRLIAAEKRLNDAKERLEDVKAEIPTAVPGRRGKRKRK